MLPKALAQLVLTEMEPSRLSVLSHLLSRLASCVSDKVAIRNVGRAADRVAQMRSLAGQAGEDAGENAAAAAAAEELLAAHRVMRDLDPDLSAAREVHARHGRHARSYPPPRALPCPPPPCPPTPAAHAL